MKKEDIFKYVKEKYNTIPEYLWKKQTNDAILRHKENNKWYAVIMNISKEKLGFIDMMENVDVINVKCYPEMIGTLRNKEGICPAYHMNKEYWITLLLDGSLSKEIIMQLIDLSFELTK